MLCIFGEDFKPIVSSGTALLGGPQYTMTGRQVRLEPRNTSRSHAKGFAGYSQSTILVQGKRLDRKLRALGPGRALQL